jgi:hypothetical protein
LVVCNLSNYCNSNYYWWCMVIIPTTLTSDIFSAEIESIIYSSL